VLLLLIRQVNPSEGVRKLLVHHYLDPPCGGLSPDGVHAIAVPDVLAVGPVGGALWPPEVGASPSLHDAVVELWYMVHWLVFYGVIPIYDPTLRSAC
jgi:hypothetical protein